MASDVVVIGAGHNGLVAACYLARAGLDVLVVEAAGHVGGMTTTQPLIAEAPHHQINPCAVDVTFFAGSAIVDDLNLRRFGYESVAVDPPYLGVEPDQASFAIWRDHRRTADEIRRFSRHDAEAYIELARTLDRAFDALFPLMLTNPLRPAPAKLAAAAQAMVRHPGILRPLGRMLTASAAEVIAERFEHPLVRGSLAMLCAASPLHTEGSGPLLLILAIANRFGIHRLIGGTQTLPDSLVRCLVAAEGRVRTSAKVEEILLRDGRVVGVRLLGGEELFARAVLASCDPRTTLLQLLPIDALAGHLRVRAEHIPVANGNASSLKIDLAMAGRLTMPRHATWRSDGLDVRTPAVLIGDLESIVDAYNQAAVGNLRTSPPLLSTIPTAVDPSQAPAGQDTLSLWMNWAPAYPNEPAESFAATAAKAVLNEAGAYYSGIEEFEIGRRVETWEDLATRTHASMGNIIHVDFNAFRMGPLRPALGFAGYRTPVPQLYLTGAGTHPSPGVTGIPGQLAARTLLRGLRRR